MRKSNDLNASFISLATLAILLLCQCKKEPSGIAENKLPPLTALPEGKKLAVVSTAGIISDSFYLINSLPLGYVKDGSRDYTTYIQSAVSKYSNIVFPAFPVLVNDKGISVGSNKTLTFLDGSEIRLKGTSNSSYSVLLIQNASNVTLYSPVIIGDRSTHIGTTGEHGMGISIKGSASAVTIYSPRITDCWGDGIYVGQANNLNPKNILIKDAYLRKNRRDGISIISVDGLVLDNIYAGYSDGTSPFCGINIEPNNTSCIVNNVKMNNVRTEYNGATGIQIGTRNMLGTSDRTSNITILNHVDIGSPRYACKIMCNSLAGTTAKQYGLIDVINPTWNRTGTNRPLYLSTNQRAFKTAVSSPEVMNTGNVILSWSATNDLLMKEARFGTLSVSNLSTTPVPIQEPTPPAPLTPVFAVNAGGSSYTGTNGIFYNADKNFNSGTVYKTSNGINNTSDDVLYQSERFGNFTYSIPLSSGSYQLTLKFAEIYYQTSGARQFDVLAEGTSIISNLDIFAVANAFTSYDVIRTVSVSDGVLNLEFRTDIEHAKLSALEIFKK
jgi:hypothetical protein